MSVASLADPVSRPPEARDAAAASEVARVDRASAVGSWLLGALAAAMVAGRFETVTLAIVVAAIAARVARAPWPRSSWYVALAWGTGLSIALNLYLVRGAPLPLPHVLGVPATREGLAAGALLALRLLGAAIALHGLRAAWPGERAADELAARLSWLERFGVRVREVRAMIALALRFAPMLATEHRRIARLQDLRAGGPARTRAGRLERMRATAIPSVIGAIETAERVTLGLEARHYRLRDLPRARGGAASAVAGFIVFGIAALWRA